MTPMIMALDEAHKKIVSLESRIKFLESENFSLDNKLTKCREQRNDYVRSITLDSHVIEMLDKDLEFIW